MAQKIEIQSVMSLSVNICSIKPMRLKVKKLNVLVLKKQLMLSSP